MPWEKGQSGNPKGRPRTAKHKLAEKFVRTLHEDFKLHGVEVIERCREESPKDYLKMIANLVPKDVNTSKTVNHNHTHVGVSETDAFLAEVIGAGAEGASEEPGADRPLLPH